MTREEAIKGLTSLLEVRRKYGDMQTMKDEIECLEIAIKALEQEPCEMTGEDYRQRMIQAFHNADTDELIAICVLPTEKEFEHLEWLLRNHYKKEPCDDAISRQAALNTFGLSEKSRKYGGDHSGYDTIMLYEVQDALEALPPVQPQPKTGHWIPVSERLPENESRVLVTIQTPMRSKVRSGMFDNERFYNDNGDTWKVTDKEVKAWMPLPKPYKAESEG